jgi:hypothetical protein
MTLDGSFWPDFATFGLVAGRPLSDNRHFGLRTAVDPLQPFTGRITMAVS